MSAAPIVRDAPIDRAASLAFTVSMVALILLLPSVWLGLAIGATVAAPIVALVGLGTAGVWALSLAILRYGLRG
jgi:hypothetical protein